MKDATLCVSVGLGALAMFYWGAQGSSSDLEIREDAARGFDMRHTSLPAAPSPASLEPLRDAMSAPPRFSPKIITPTPAPAPAKPQEAKRAGREATATERAGYLQLLTSPGRYIVSKTLLGKPSQLAGLLQTKDFGKSYVMLPLVRGVLESPRAVSMILKNQAIMTAFLTSPAMKDPKTVQALADSALLMYVLTSPGVKKALQDPVVYRQVFMSPQTAAWLGSNPEARGALGRLTAAIARS